jgi:uncharacterized protein YcbK (DUF882 family)
MISKKELTMGRDVEYKEEYSKTIDNNINILLEKINVVRAKYGKPMTVSSGWRPLAVNKSTAGAAKASKHLSGLAVDIRDLDNSLWNWCIENLQLMQELGLYLEDRRFTKTWVHFQIGPPRSGLRIFKPTTAPMPHPNLWNGIYDKKFDKA